MGGVPPRCSDSTGLIVGTVERSEDSKAMKVVDLADFDLRINPSAITQAARALTHTGPERGAKTKEQP